MHFVRKINDRGVMTLPAAVRQAMGIREGDYVEFKVMNVFPAAEAESKGANLIPAQPTAASMQNAGGIA